MEKEKKKDHKKVRLALLVGIIALLILFATSGVLWWKIYHLQVLPARYFLLAIILFTLIIILFGVLMTRKKLYFKIPGYLLSVVLFAIMLFCILFTDRILEFLKEGFDNETVKVGAYSIYVLKNSEYENIKDLENQTIAYFNADPKNEQVQEKLTKQVNATFTGYDDLYELVDAFLENEVSSMVMDKGRMDLIYDEYLDEDFQDFQDNSFDDLVRVIFTFDLEEEQTDISKEVYDIETEPINIFISGMDTRNHTLTDVSRSDVNMIATINPNTKEILLTSIPRDYYVQVHGQTGLKDKLTHAGLYGIETSVATVEDLMHIDINYYVKINFDSLIEIIDLIGGVDVYSEYTFTTYHVDSEGNRVKVQKGYNSFNGSEALAFARERYAFKIGDRMRVQNQQAVLKAIVTKVTSDITLLQKYDELLDALTGLYITNLPSNVITNYARMQIDDMSPWTITTQWVNGGDAYLPTHTAPNSKPYVMTQDQESLTKARNAIDALMAKTSS